MSDVLAVLGWLLAIGALIRLHVALWSRVFADPQFGDQVHFAWTDDQWRLALHRYLPREPRYAEPVLLVPGLAINRHNYDMGESRSLARDLRHRGFDVWVLELRGSGLSSQPALFSRFRSQFDFEDHLHRDIPAALATIRMVTQAEELFWVGNSMGGLLGYAWLSQQAAVPKQKISIRGLVTISSPVLLSAARQVKWTHHLVRPMFAGRVLFFRAFARFFAPLMGFGPRSLSRIVVLADGMEGAVMRRCLVNAVDNVSGRLMRQFFSWIHTDGFTSRDRSVHYLERLSQISTPSLIVAADADQIAPPDTVAPAYERIRAEDKQLRIFGIDRGDEHDFGHGDMLLGRHSRPLVYPEIMDWLEARATAIGDGP